MLRISAGSWLPMLPTSCAPLWPPSRQSLKECRMAFYQRPGADRFAWLPKPLCSTGWWRTCACFPWPKPAGWTLDLQPIAPGDLVRRAVELMQPIAQQQGVNLIADPPGDLPRVLGDSDRLIQVLNNLITNSLRYTPAGGTVTVTAVYSAASKTVAFSVTDTGAGIDPRDLPHVFDRLLPRG